MNSTACPLCKNPEWDKRSACKLCGAKEYHLFGIILLGYLYPAEGEMIKKFLRNVVLLVVFFALVTYLAVNYLSITTPIV